MISLDYPHESNTIYIIDKYNNKRAKHQIQKGINKLEILNSGLFYLDSFANKFLVYETNGNLDFANALMCFDFIELSVYDLDYYLSNLEYSTNTSEKSKQLIQDFIKCVDLGNLFPNNFIQLQKQILGEKDGK